MKNLFNEQQMNDQKISYEVCMDDLYYEARIATNNEDIIFMNGDVIYRGWTVTSDNIEYFEINTVEKLADFVLHLEADLAQYEARKAAGQIVEFDPNF